MYCGFSYSTLKFAPASWAIRALQKGRYSHSFIMVYIEDRKNWYIVDATGHGVRVRTLEMFLKENHIVKKYPVPVGDTKEVLYWGIEKSGLKYPKMELFGNFVQVVIFRLFGKVIKNPFGQGQNFPKCNELIAMALIDFYGVKIDKDLDSIDLIYLDKLLKDITYDQNIN